jgi:type II secretory pathway pseudopilin PulG
MFKIIVVIILLLIISALFSSFYYMYKDQGKSDRAVRALTWRIGMSIFLFILLMIGAYTGLIEPHGVYH